MHQTKFALAVLTAAVLAGCGSGSGSGDQTLKTKFSAQVTFGDSLADVGTYQVGGVKAMGGGKFTINGDNTAINPALTGKNWTELMAAQLGLPAPCPAETGLDGDASLGFSVPVVLHAGCYGYAMGGARVTNPVGPNNKLTGSSIGALTLPVVTQIQNHLTAVGGKFKGDEMVFVMAGGNDALFLLTKLKNDATAAGTAAGNAEGARVGGITFAQELAGFLAAGATNPAAAGPVIGLAIQTEAARSGNTPTSIVTAAVIAAAGQGNATALLAAHGDPTAQAAIGVMAAKAQTDAQAAGAAAGATAGASAGAAYATAHGPELVAAMSTAGSELVALVKTQILAKGANYVTVNNLGDVASTPSGRQDPSSQPLIMAMVDAFNKQLNDGLGAEPKVLVVDVYAVSHDQAVNPGPYGLTNVTDPACIVDDVTKNPLSSSLGCNASNLKAGDISHYSFADTVHPTPFNYLLLARYVSEKLVVKGWL